MAGKPQVDGSAQTLEVRPRFLAARPLVRDYSVSVGLVPPDGGWSAQSDGTPVHGAIPTLKWLWGWLVIDRRRLALPARDSPEAVRLTLTVYDAFTLEPLTVLDDRLLRLGQGQAAEVATVDIR